METQPTDLSRLKIDRKNTADAPSPRYGFRKAVWITVALLIIIIAVVSYRLLAPSTPMVEVAVVTSVDSSYAATLLNASGYVVAQRRAAVASKGTGRLVELNVKEGDRVRKGDVLARLESADVAAARARAQANLSVARSALDQAIADLDEATLSYERKKDLLGSGMVSKADFDAAEARYRRTRAAVSSAKAGVRVAEASVQAAQVDFENTIIRAPFDGTILTRNAEVGEVVAPFGSSTSAKAAVVTMADMASLEVEADVSESNIEKIHVGQRCEITLDSYPDAKYEGIVATIVPTADRAKATVLTKIRFQNRDDRVLPEMSARVAFLSEPTGEAGKKPVIAVSPAVIITRGDRRVAFLIEGDRVKEMPVEVGSPVGGLVEVRQGLAPGDRVVINPPEGLTSGARVRIVSK